VKKANGVISKADKHMSLAILDIFGFEVRMGVTGDTFWMLSHRRYSEMVFFDLC
jgi:hypothetical protein